MNNAMLHRSLTARMPALDACVSALALLWYFLSGQTWFLVIDPQGLIPGLDWLVRNEPYIKALGSAGAAIVVFWRGGTALWRSYCRQREKRRRFPKPPRKLKWPKAR